MCKTKCEHRAGRPISVSEGAAAQQVRHRVSGDQESLVCISLPRPDGAAPRRGRTMLRQVQNAQMQMIIKQRFENVPGRAAAGRGCRGRVYNAKVERTLLPPTPRLRARATLLYCEGRGSAAPSARVIRLCLPCCTRARPSDPEL